MSIAPSNFLEHAPLAARDWLVSIFPAPLHWLVHHLITIVAILAVFGLFFALLTVVERKLLGRIQNRLGPNRAGLPFMKGKGPRL
ncbi:MAG TPA: NADH-quinone oxidoreductase subunit H, partial [Opitutus sp.]|nr:NADH-quinone oxidoreductase subunit H [Opitutus sp.]